MALQSPLLTTHTTSYCAHCVSHPTPQVVLTTNPLHFATGPIEVAPLMHCPSLRPVDRYAPRTGERQQASLTCARTAGEVLDRSSADGRGLLPKQTQRMTPPKNTVTKIRMRSIVASHGQQRKIDGVRYELTPLLRRFGVWLQKCAWNAP